METLPVVAGVVFALVPQHGPERVATAEVLRKVGPEALHSRDAVLREWAIRHGPLARDEASPAHARVEQDDAVVLGQLAEQEARKGLTLLGPY